MWIRMVTVCPDEWEIANGLNPNDQVMLIKIVQVTDIRILKSVYPMESVQTPEDWRDLKNNYDH